jgi:hypothetical protein
MNESELLHTRQLRYPRTNVSRTGSFASPPYDGFAFHWQHNVSHRDIAINCKYCATASPMAKLRLPSLLRPHLHAGKQAVPGTPAQNTPTP